MTVAELLEGVQFITDADGNKKAVVVDLVVWEGMLARLEDLERLADEVDERSWDEAFAKFPDALARLAGEARGERQAGRTRELDPDTL
jgi:hypothetical protein